MFTKNVEKLLFYNTSVDLIWKYNKDLLILFYYKSS